MNILLDTNIVIYFLKGVRKVVESVSKADKVVISFITEIELQCYGVLPNELKKIKSFLKEIEILYPDKTTVRHTVNIRNKTSLKLPDAIICAQSKQHNFVLFTNDERILKKSEEFEVFNPL